MPVCKTAIIFIISMFISESSNAEYFADSRISNCLKFKNEFANISAQATQCLLDYSQPLRICSNCLKQKQAFTSRYDKLINNEIKDGTVDCELILLQSDMSTIIYDFQNFLKTEWDNVNCENCYKDKYSNFTEEYMQFFQLAKVAMDCLQVFTNASLNFSNPEFETIWQGYSFSNSACTVCKANYSDVNRFYGVMQEHIKGKEREKLWNGVCGDVGDIMNTTRYLWSKEFKCDNRQPNLIFSLPLFIVIVINLLFYCLASTYFHDKMRVVFYKQRRLKYMSNNEDNFVTQT